MPARKKNKQTRYWYSEESAAQHRLDKYAHERKDKGPYRPYVQRGKSVQRKLTPEEYLAAFGVEMPAELRSES